LGRAGRSCAECVRCTERRSFTACDHSDSDTGTATTNRNAIDRAAVNCLTSSHSDRDTTTDCIRESNANSNSDAASEPFTNFDPHGNSNCNRNSASKSDADANGNSNSAAEP
jgi:hypothetical protein